MLASLAKAVQFNTEEVQECKKKVQTLEEQNAKLKKEVTKLKERVHEQERYKMRWCLCIRGLEEKDDVPQQNDFNQEEVLGEQQLLNQERNFTVVQVGEDCSQIKEEQEDVCISQEGEQFGLKQETQTFDEDAPQLHYCKEEVLTVQQLWNQERNSSLDQEEQDAAQVKQEEEELCSSQEEEHFGLKQETDTFMVTPTDEDNDNSETEPNSEQLLSHNSPDTESQDQGADVPQQNNFNQEEVLDEQQLLNQERNFTVVQVGADCSQIKEEQEDVCISQEGEQFRLKQETQTFDEDTPQLHDCQEEAVLTVQQLWNQERNSSLDQEEQDAAQDKEEEELCTSQEEEHFGLKQDTDTFVVTPTDEDNDNSETEPNSERLLSHNSPDTESQDQEAGKNVDPGSSKHEETKKRLHRNRSDSNSVDNSSMSENQCDTDTGEKSVNCSDKDCKNESQKKKHHTVDKPHVCNTCGERFYSRGNLSVHERIHIGEKRYSSEASEQSFKQCDILETYMTIHTDKKQFSCETCGQTFNQHGHLKQYVRTQSGERPFSYGTCGQCFSQLDHKKKHMRTHTGEDPTDTFMVTPTNEDDGNSETEPNSEQLLSYNSPDTESLDQGAGRNVNPGSSKHEETKPKKRRLNSNNVDNFPMSDNQCDTDTGEKSINCSDKDKDCNDESQKKKHHTVDYAYMCNTCGNKFSNRGNLAVHERVHIGEKRSEVSGQSLKECDILKTYMTIHTGEEQFSCETCGHSFSQRANLKQHMRIHTGEKPFSCETCGKRFNRCAHLKLHVRIHTGERPFSCGTCGQSFSRRDSLNTHMRIHTGEKPYSCKMCGKCFTQCSTLNHHMGTHS
ncbi:uncharacterized protein KZ484_015062 [Pholidichthys leucotaenia]